MNEEKKAVKTESGCVQSPLICKKWYLDCWFFPVWLQSEIQWAFVPSRRVFFVNLKYQFKKLILNLILPRISWYSWTIRQISVTVSALQNLLKIINFIILLLNEILLLHICQVFELRRHFQLLNSILTFVKPLCRDWSQLQIDNEVWQSPVILEPLFCSRYCFFLQVLVQCL
jgi:hypothetical protein